MSIRILGLQTGVSAFLLLGLAAGCNSTTSISNLVLPEGPISEDSEIPSPSFTPPISTVNATAVFSDSFNNHENWTPPQSQTGATNTCILGQICTTPVPSGYHDYRVAAAESCSNLDGNHETLNINDLHPRGGTGKSFVMWSEPCYSSGGSWGSDGLLGVHFPDRNEVYVRYWIQFQPDWQWPTDVSPSPMQKFLHLSHLNPSLATSIWSFFDGTQNKPRFTPQLAKFGGGSYRIQFDLPHSPLTAARNNSASFNSDVYLGASPLDWTTPGPAGLPAPGDGNWHSFEFFVRMNTAGNADGAEKVWYDGNLVNSTTGIAWVPAGDDPDLWKWNHVWLGGNNSVLNASGEEQWYAVDDFVVSDHYSGPPPKPANVAAQSTGEKTVQLSWTEGENSAEYLLSGHRIYYGTSATDLNQSVEADSSNHFELGGLSSGQTYYFQVSAIKSASYDSNENESLRSAVVSALVN
ncbi:MAG: hypothetical protein A2X94_09035 [Bdellovibrionales bacterium GWB1_55_8]|nr:MAG: hypothetical protein A2X94_09035 [Bdellovibrionales bacterium GWB1_55_8]